MEDSEIEDLLPFTVVSSDPPPKLLDVVPSDLIYNFMFLGWAHDCKFQYLLKEGVPLPHSAKLPHGGKC